MLLDEDEELEPDLCLALKIWFNVLFVELVSTFTRPLLSSVNLLTITFRVSTSRFTLIMQFLFSCGAEVDTRDTGGWYTHVNMVEGREKVFCPLILSGNEVITGSIGCFLLLVRKPLSLLRDLSRDSHFESRNHSGWWVSGERSNNVALMRSPKPKQNCLCQQTGSVGHMSLSLQNVISFRIILLENGQVTRVRGVHYFAQFSLSHKLHTGW